MTSFYIIIVLIMGGALIGAWLLYNTSMVKRFERLQPLVGKSKSAIIEVVGEPTSMTHLAGRKTLLQWHSEGFHIALQFDEKDLCETVTHETK